MRFYIGNEYSPLCVVTKKPIKKFYLSLQYNSLRNPINKENKWQVQNC